MDKLPCGWVYRLPEFCKKRKCETCILRKDNKPKGGGNTAQQIIGKLKGGQHNDRQRTETH